eukprot:3110374-Rhodomonas_salina.2
MHVSRKSRSSHAGRSSPGATDTESASSGNECPTAAVTEICFPSPAASSPGATVATDAYGILNFFPLHRTERRGTQCRAGVVRSCWCCLVWDCA